MNWKVRGGTMDLATGRIMGIVNVTPDSFSDGGKFLDHDLALRWAMRLLEEGAEILDIGGESTRPGSEPVDQEEELRRVIPLVRALSREGAGWISVDTMKPEVARVALEEGAHIINDVGGWRDPAMRQLAAERECGWILMHMRGTPKTMQNAPEYPDDDVTADVLRFFDQKLAEAREAGVAKEFLSFDPGIGFGKTAEHNLKLLADTPRLVSLGCPVCIGVSRKSFLRTFAPSDDMAARTWPTVALTSLTREAGALIFRVHDAKENRQALRMTEAVLAAEAQ